MLIIESFFRKHKLTDTSNSFPSQTLGRDWNFQKMIKWQGESVGEVKKFYFSVIGIDVEVGDIKIKRWGEEGVLPLPTAD